MATCYKPSLTPAQTRLCLTYRNLGLWTFQGWLAMFYLAAGYAKLTEPMENLITLMAWPARVGEELVRGVGMVEIILALGVLAPILSWRLGRPVLLTATLGLIVLQSFMLSLHLIDQSYGLVAVNAILLALTVTVFVGRRPGEEAKS